MDLIKFLRRIPLFESFDNAELKKLSELMVEKTLEKGAIVCKRGEPGDSLCLIFSGEMEVWSGNKQDTLINRMGSGDIFGEVAMLLEGKRTSTVIVTRRARIFELNRYDFEKNFFNSPEKLKSLYTVIARRLTQATREKPSPRLLTVISVLGPTSLKGKSMLSHGLSALLEQFTKAKTLVLCLHVTENAKSSRDLCIPFEKITWDSKALILNHIKNKSHHKNVLDIGLTPSVSANKIQDCLSRVFQNISGIYPFVLIDPGTDHLPLTHAVFHESDVVINFQRTSDIERVPANPSQKIFRVINQYNTDSSVIPVSDMDPFILPADSELEHMSPDAGNDYLCINKTTAIARPVHRLARKILGSTIGVALGGGAAFGLSHIGVLKVLDDHNIPIDLLAGTSMGSAVAIGYASGLKGRDMIEMAKKMGTLWKTLSAAKDITLFRPGILEGGALKKTLSPLLNGNKMFEDLMIPCRTVATDIEDGTRVTIASGKLEDAIRCSASVPLVWSPVVYRDRVLVDGAINDPVPAEVVREMGADICIAVNVVPPLKKGTETVLSKIYKRVNRFNPIAIIGNRRQLPNLFDIIMNSIQTLQYELGNFKAGAADILINPDLAGYTWVEFYKPMDFITKGIEAAEPAIPGIKELLSERMTSYS